MNLLHFLLKTEKAILKAGIFLLFFIAVPAHAQDSPPKNELFQVSGKVLATTETGKLAALENATVSISEYLIGTTSGATGEFSFSRIPAGKVHLRVQYLGMVPLDTLINVSGNLTLSLVLKPENFRLKEVRFVVVQSPGGQSTSSLISGMAIDHLQATSLFDVMSLLPGGLTSNQDLTNAKQLTLRNVSSGSDEMNAFGVSIVRDGAPVSNNANLQVMNPAVIGATTTPTGGTSPSGGTDLRLFSAGNIGSIEVIRGIPSAQYGDLTSGAVILHSKAGVQPLQVNVKANPKVYQFYAAKGFSLGKNKGNLHISGDYAHSTADPTQSYKTYERSNIRFLYSNRFFDKLTSNTSLNLIYGADRRRLNPDDLINQLRSRGDNLGVTLNTNGILLLRKPWLTNIRYVASASYLYKKSKWQQVYASATSPYSSTTTDGAVLSNRPGTDVYDSEGNKITNFEGNDALLAATQLPNSYLGRYQIEGKEVNTFLKLWGNLYKRIGNTHHAMLLGADFKTDGNNGRGKTFSAETPPYRNLSAVNATFRPRSYKDIPYMNQLGLFAEETFRYQFGGHEFSLSAGARYDRVFGLDDAWSPRINASFGLLPRKLFIRGGYGITAKAPSVLYLHPEKAYFEYVNINELSNESIAEDERLYITTTRVFDTENEALKIARNKKAEIGFDLKTGKASLYVTAFREKLRDGYEMAVTTSSFQPVTYNQYSRVNDQIVLTQSNPVLAKYYIPTNNLQAESEGIEFELDVARINPIRTSFSLNGMWIRSVSYSGDYTYFDGYSGTGGANRTHIGMYEKGMERDYDRRFSTTLRATHNIPEIGFVITLTAQAIWKEDQWYRFANDSIPVKYVSKYDGKVYDFDPESTGDPEFGLLLRQVNKRLYIREEYAPAYTFNINVTKELGDLMRVSFFANNMFRSYPSVRSNRNPSNYNIRRQQFFFGLELSLKL
ncbi:MAG: carboxypeptidase-like regulatory domain-containing protein [Mangrovibacterium sp.]